MSTSKSRVKKSSSSSPGGNAQSKRSSLPLTLSVILPFVLILSLFLPPQNPILPSSSLLTNLQPFLPTKFLPSLFSLSGTTTSVRSITAPSTLNSIPHSIRTHWMRRAISIIPTHLSSPCAFAPFTSVVVNHTSASASNPLGDEICLGGNLVSSTGNPNLHGEVATIGNCTAVLSAPPYNLSPAEILAAWSQLTLYTTGEPCPMCASAIRWSGFKECVFATSIETLVELGWGQIGIKAEEVFGRSAGLKGNGTGLLGGVERGKTDGLFGWQFRREAECPEGCRRGGEGGGCVVEEE